MRGINLGFRLSQLPEVLYRDVSGNPKQGTKRKRYEYQGSIRTLVGMF